VHAARAGESTTAVLVGEGGVGKTRLLAEVARESRQLGLPVLSGRSPVTTPVAFSVVAEALRSWLRAHPTETSMAPYDAGLRLVLPEWPSGAQEQILSEAQLRLLALEGVVRLVQHIAASSPGVAILLDDLHVADHESLEAIRYLAGASLDRVLIVGAMRPREATLPDQVVRSLQQDDVATIFEIEPLGQREVTDLLGALLDAEPPAELVADVISRTDGVPLLVEEVLDAHLRSGSVDLSEGDVKWRGGTTTVSRTIIDMVRSRLDRIAAHQREVLTAGAVVGDFEATLLGAVVQRSAAVVGDAVAAGIDVGLLETISGAIDFRHDVIREAVLEGMLPHEVVAVHRRAATSLAERAADDATSLERRANHLAQIDERDEAAALLAAAAVRRLHEHALLSAEATARRALELCNSTATRAAASDALASALAVQGRWMEAFALDDTTTHDHGETPARRLRMASCAVEAARPELATALIERAIEAGDESPHIQVLAGRIAVTSGDADFALKAAEGALAAAAAADDLEARCAALDLQARAFDFVGRRSEAIDTWTRQAAEAEAAGLTDARLRAVIQLGKLELFDGRPPERLYEAVELAQAAGALVEQAWAEENLAICIAIQGDPAASLRLLEDAIARCRELRLDQVAYLLVSKGGGFSMLDPDNAEQWLAEAERLDPSPYLTLATNGIRGDLALRAGRYAEAIEWDEQVMEVIRTVPGGVPSDTPAWLAWTYAAAGRTDDARRMVDEVRAMPGDLARWHSRPVVLAALEAVLDGDESAFDDAITSAPGRMPFDIAQMRVSAAEILGGPSTVRWLRDALDTYDAAGAEAASARVRRLLREAGGPVPRRRRVGADVPDELAKHGVTSREAEVLRLLGDGLSNAVIAERLYLSVRTVETHVSSLLAKLHVENRGQLTALSATLSFGDASA
jgi:DNA-binding CsgD family transcriptional regulator/tetratricopeptide (TPR) repeat protein